jgi:Phosphatidylinositol-glycan biosynthesis class S protein
MAGTRLRIVSIFISTLLLWVGWTIRGSRLHQDVRIQRQVAMALHPLVRAVFGGSPSPPLLVTTGSSLDALQALKFPPLVITIGTTTNSTVATMPSAALGWGSGVQIVAVQPNDLDYWNQVCANPNLLFDLDQTDVSSRWESLTHANHFVPYPDVVVCQQEPFSETTRIVWVPISATSTIALFYPSRHSTALSSSQLLQPLLGLMNEYSMPYRSDDSLLSVRLALIMEPTVPYWKDIVELVMQRSAMDMQDRIEVQVDRSVWFDRDTMPAADTAGSHALDLELVPAVWTKHVPVNVDNQRLLNVVLYVPSTPLHLHNQDNVSSMDAVWGNGDAFLFLVQATTQQMTEPVAVLSAVESTLERIQQELLLHSWRLPTSSTDKVSVQVLSPSNESSDGKPSGAVVMVPSLQQTWRASATLSRRWKMVQQVAASTQGVLVATAAAEAGTKHAQTEAYKSAWEHVQQAHCIATALASTTAHNESFALLVDQVHHYLDEAESTWTTILQDGAWSAAPVVDLPLEQYAAIFLPLLFPLLVPVLVTLLREYQRYRALVSKQRGGRHSNQ